LPRRKSCGPRSGDWRHSTCTLRGGLTAQDERRLREAVNKATLIYRYWRPELRYKTVEVPEPPLQEVQRAAKWLLDNQKQL
jgi:hypothetical protein